MTRYRRLLLGLSGSLVSCGPQSTTIGGAYGINTPPEVPPGQAACSGAAAASSFVSANISGSNSMTVSVSNTGLCGGSFNTPCASVTVCTPGNNNQCQVIPNLLVD